MTHLPVMVVLAFTEPLEFGVSEVMVLGVSSAFHLAYIISLQRGYVLADLTLV